MHEVVLVATECPENMKFGTLLKIGNKQESKREQTAVKKKTKRDQTVRRRKKFGKTRYFSENIFKTCFLVFWKFLVTLRLIIS